MNFDKPKEIDNASSFIGISGNCDEFVPKYEDIPSEFKNKKELVLLVRKWFYVGVGENDLCFKEDIKSSDAIRHLSGVLRSFDIPHERKIDGVAYLMSQWCDTSKMNI